MEGRCAPDSHHLFQVKFTFGETFQPNLFVQRSGLVSASFDQIDGGVVRTGKSWLALKIIQCEAGLIQKVLRH